jgi:hypothetical protein
MALTQTYTGRACYYSRHQTERGKLILAVKYQINEHTVLSLLDTGAEWGIFPADLAAALGYEAQAGDLESVLLTRHGRITGHLLRIPIHIPAEEGDGLDIEPTWLVAPDWPGLPAIGWGRCLEHFRFALDPTPGQECFYFGPTSE